MTTSTNTTPIRGTQTFVGAMSFVWKHPSLTAREILWRWSFGIPFLALLWFAALKPALTQIGPIPDFAFLISHHLFIFGVDMHGLSKVTLYAITLAILWAILSTLGRAPIYRRIAPELAPNRTATALIAVLRILLFSLFFGTWLYLLVHAALRAIAVSLQADPYVTYLTTFALFLAETLALFFAWSLLSWIFTIATIHAIANGTSALTSLRAALQQRSLRNKLIEINFVMGIVKVALLVLLMVACASPLPFTNNQTESYLHVWWALSFTLWLLASDYFHVIRLTANIRLWQLQGTAPPANPAS